MMTSLPVCQRSQSKGALRILGDRRYRVVLLVKFLILYVIRVVIAKGVLAKRSVRLAGLAMAIGCLCISTALVTIMLRQFEASDQVVKLAFSINSISAILWTAIAFLIVKLLLSDSGTMMSLTRFFPVTNRDRQAALSRVEAAFLGILITAGLISFCLGALITYGARVIEPFLTCVALPSLASFVVLRWLWDGLDLLMSAIGLRQLRLPILLAALMLGIIRLWIYIPRFLGAVTLGKPTSMSQVWPLVFKRLTEQVGWVFLVGSFVILVLLISVQSLLFPSAPLIRRRRYLTIRLGVLNSCIGFHLRASGRSRYYVGAGIISLIVIIAFRFNHASWSSIWACEPLTVIGFFHYATVNRPLRVLEPRLVGWRLYARIVVSDILLILPVLCLYFCFDMITGRSYTSSLVGVAGVVISLILTECIGICMPAEDDNPVSVFLGTGLVFGTVALIVLMGAIVRPSGLILWTGIAILGVLVATFSIARIVEHRRV